MMRGWQKGFLLAGKESRRSSCSYATQEQCFKVDVRPEVHQAGVQSWGSAGWVAQHTQYWDSMGMH